jgi:hypothetical protein
MISYHLILLEIVKAKKKNQTANINGMKKTESNYLFKLAQALDYFLTV